MVEAWRIVPVHRAAVAFKGEGARLYGGRWNLPGRAAIYLAGTRALAALETLVHLDRVANQHIFVRFKVTIPDGLLDQSLQNANAKGAPAKAEITSLHVHPATQRYGDTWLRRAEAAALAIPSAIIPEEPNFLINPAHPSFTELQIGQPEPFTFDPRLIPTAV